VLPCEKENLVLWHPKITTLEKQNLKATIFSFLTFFSAAILVPPPPLFLLLLEEAAGARRSEEELHEEDWERNGKKITKGCAQIWLRACGGMTIQGAPERPHEGWRWHPSSAGSSKGVLGRP
jgi:hypothetical protein